MAILTLTGVAQSFGDFDLFNNASGAIPQQGKVGLVGPNGIGKTSLLLIIVGQRSPSRGSVNIAGGTRIGYLTQESMNAFDDPANTVYAEMLSVFTPLRQMERRLRQLEAQMAAGDVEDVLFEAYSDLQLKFEHRGGYTYEQRIRRTLEGLGFGRDEWEMPLELLSGGQKTRALLARLLLDRPDLLILDEPTNHLDVEAVEWLEATLRAWDGALLIVSHDRYFLDNVVDSIWEMTPSGIETYRGNYTAYVDQRDARWAERQRVYDQMMERFFKELDYVKRNIARDSTKDQAVGRLKRLIRLVKMAHAGGPEALDMDWARASARWGISGAKWEVPDVEAGIKALPRPSGRLRTMRLDFTEPPRSGKLVLRTRNLEVGYPDNVLFTCDDIEFHRLERAALIGPNGAGKTTFLKTLLGRLEPLAGDLRLGASLKIGYFAQAHDSLEGNHTVLDALTARHPMLPGDARSYLGRFLFSGDDVFKPVSLLSGGERGRLALAILSLEGANFLLLDEPTNHLDILAQEELESVLALFAGTILMVSHDRYLISKLATQIWAIEGDRLRVYPGDYANYLTLRNGSSDSASAANAGDNGTAPAVEDPAPAGAMADGTSANRAENLSKNERWRREQQMAALERDIAAHEAAINEAETEVTAAAAAGDYERIHAAGERLHTLQAELDALLEAWGEVAL